tara:strand:+ start:20809 stop:21996 length:1188 start_codon:yes stop_codon:yes gene_type:complete
MRLQILSENFIGYEDLEIKEELFGGQEILLKETCLTLREKGYQVSVVQFGKEYKEFNYNGIPITQIKVPKFKFLQRLGFIRRWTWAGMFFVKYLDKEADWIHLHNHHFSFPLVFFKKKYQIMTGMNHGVEWDVPWTYEKLNLKNIRDRFSFFLLRKVSNFSICKLNKLITNDRFFFHFATLFKPSLSEKFQYIPNYFDEEFVEGDIKRCETIKAIEKFSNSKKIVYLPKMSMRERGTDILIKACSYQEEWKLVISGLSHQQEYFINLVNRLDLKDKVFFTGHITRSTQRAIFLKSDIVVIPSPCREATAIALLEAMAFEKPIVASEIGGLVEVIWDNYNGLLSKPTANEFKKKINYLLKNPEIAKYYAKNARHDAYFRFNKKIWRESINRFFVRN